MLRKRTNNLRAQSRSTARIQHAALPVRRHFGCAQQLRYQRRSVVTKLGQRVVKCFRISVKQIRHVFISRARRRRISAQRRQSVRGSRVVRDKAQPMLDQLRPRGCRTQTKNRIAQRCAHVVDAAEMMQRARQKLCHRHMHRPSSERRREHGDSLVVAPEADQRLHQVVMGFNLGRVMPNRATQKRHRFTKVARSRQQLPQQSQRIGLIRMPRQHRTARDLRIRHVSRAEQYVHEFHFSCGVHGSGREGLKVRGIQCSRDATLAKGPTLPRCNHRVVTLT